MACLFSHSGRLKCAKNDGGGKDFVDILLVEDDDDDIELILHAFKKARVNNYVQVVSDGSEAVDYVFCRGNYAQRNSEKRPQVILSDLNLPKVRGLEVFRPIKVEKRTRKISVVVLTGSQNSQDIAERRRLGAENYIVKLVDFKRLSQAMPQLNLNWDAAQASGNKCAECPGMIFSG
jgi:two-component system, response regulator